MSAAISGVQKWPRMSLALIRATKRDLRPLLIIIRPLAKRDPSQHAAHCHRGAQRLDRRRHGALERELERIAHRLLAGWLLRQADAAQYRSEEVQIVQPPHFARLPGDRHRDRERA